VIKSTIFHPDLDFKFRNDTPYSVLIETSYTKDSITVSMWSTKIYDSVKTEYGPRRDVTKPQAIHLPAGRRASPPAAGTVSPRTRGGWSARAARRSSGRSSPGSTRPNRATSAMGNRLSSLNPCGAVRGLEIKLADRSRPARG
jgi:hypothetical protein